MTVRRPFLIQSLILLSLLFSTQLLISCGGSEVSSQEATIEDTEGGLDLIEREFGECNDEPGDMNVPKYLRPNNTQSNRIGSYQNEVEKQYPHTYSSLGEMYPLRGSFRQSKKEILDIVDRYIWSPELGRGVRLLHYFDMVLLINVGERTSQTPKNSSAQRMQVLVRSGSSNELKNWKRLQSWTISSGTPCGSKIATFTGVYKLNPKRLYSEYKSAQYDDIEMYETMFLHHDYLNGKGTGVAIHGTFDTVNLGRQASGGCIRLYQENSKCLHDTLLGLRNKTCLGGGLLDYRGTVPSLMSRYGEADPEYYSSGKLEMSGVRVLVAIFNETEDLL